ncbi:MAG: hypothetical protein N2037_09785 [Acidimicrobiales bacterium]|nr:hypothetical protein [Acidimicrobiales bacterium]
MTLWLGILTTVVVLEALLIVGLLRSHGLILRRLHELGAGIGDPAERDADQREVAFVTRPGVPEPRRDVGFADATDIVGTGPDGSVSVIRVTDVDHDSLLAFLSSGCATCSAFFEAFADLDALTLPPGTRLVIVTKGPEAESPAVIAERAPKGVVLVMSSEAWEQYRVPGSPYFVYVDGPTGRIRGEGTGMSWEQVAGLLAQATGDLRFVSRQAAARRTKPLSDAERERQIDEELIRAGILPGDPSLYPGEAPRGGADEA